MRAVYFEQIGLVRRLFNLNDMSECLLKDWQYLNKKKKKITPLTQSSTVYHLHILFSDIYGTVILPLFIFLP